MVNGDTPAQPATDQTDQSVTDQVAPDQTQGDTPAQPAPDALTPEALQAQLQEKEQKIAEMDANYQALQQQVQLMSTAQQFGTQPAQQQPQQQPAQEDPYAEWADYDYVPLEAAKKRDAELRQTYDQKFAAIQEQVFQATHPDYNEVVGAPDPITGQLQISDHLNKALTKNPALVNWIKSQPDDNSAKDAAYKIAKQEKDLAASQQPANNGNAAQAAAAQAYAENTASARIQPGSAAAVGGDGAVNAQTNVAAMDEDAFDAHERDVLSGRFDKV